MKSIKVIFGILILIVFLVQGSYSQDRTLVKINNELILKGDSEIREMKIEVTEENYFFEIKFYCKLQSGKIKIEIFDTKGKKQGSFLTGKKTDSNELEIGKNIDLDGSHESVSGEIIKEKARLGEWTIKITPDKAFGIFHMFYEQYPNTQIYEQNSKMKEDNKKN